MQQMGLWNEIIVYTMEFYPAMFCSRIAIFISCFGLQGSDTSCEPMAIAVSLPVSDKIYVARATTWGENV